jgi:hypothetical protein
MTSEAVPRTGHARGVGMGRIVPALVASCFVAIDFWTSSFAGTVRPAPACLAIRLAQGPLHLQIHLRAAA